MKGKAKRKIPVVLIFFVLLTFIVLAVAYYYYSYIIKAPAQKLDQIRNEFAGKALEKGNVVDTSLLKNPEYLKLVKERAVLQSKVSLAETDSIYLAVNFADSIISVEICGVVLHKAKIRDLQVSKILDNKNERSLLYIFGSPLTIANSISSIRKEPLMIKVAPKDTSEYKPDIMPDTSKTEQVNYILEMNNGLRIYVYQTELDNKEDKIAQLRFDLDDRIKDTWESIRSVMAKQVPEYHIFVKMHLSRTDAKIIYRAVPKYGQIAFSGW